MPLIRSRWLVIAVLITIGLLPTASAHADEGPSISTPTAEQLAIDNGATVTSQVSNVVWRARGWSIRRVGAVRTFILDPRLQTGTDGKPCVFIGQIEGEPGSITEANN